MVKAIPGFKEDVICKRIGGKIETNIPHKIVRHSPDGFNWGYAGSGPAEFALNILTAYAGQEFAERYYQVFKRNFLQNMPNEGGTIPYETIMAWIESKVLFK